MLVVLVLLTTGAAVSWTKIAVWVELRDVGRLGYFRLAEPWTFSAMGRYEHILIGQRINWFANVGQLLQHGLT